MAKQRRSKTQKPKDRTFTTSNGRSYSLISIFEDYYAEQFAEEDDIVCNRTPVLFGEHIFEGLSYKDQINFSREVSAFLLEYANYLETVNKNEDPNGQTKGR